MSRLAWDILAAAFILALAGIIVWLALGATAAGTMQGVGI